MTDKTAWEGREPLTNIKVKGRGFDARNGGFALIVIDGKAHCAQVVASRVNNFPALEAERDALREALADIAKQHLINEMEDPDGDYEFAYECCVKVARQALAISEKTE